MTQKETDLDLISRQDAIDAMATWDLQELYLPIHFKQLLEELPSVSTEANKEDIHREREQAYMKGYEDASKRYRTEPCEDAISRSDAIRVASGYCHWSNIPDELAKLPSVSAEKTGRWIPYCYQNCECSICGYIISESDSEEFNFCPNCGAKMEAGE